MSNCHNEKYKAKNERHIEHKKYKNEFDPKCENCKESINQNEFRQFQDCKENHFYHEKCIKRFEGCNKCYGNKIKESKKKTLEKQYDKTQIKNKYQDKYQENYQEKYQNNNSRDLNLEMKKINDIIDNFYNSRPNLIIHQTITTMIL